MTSRTSMTPRRLLALAAIVALTVVAAACGSDSASSSDDASTPSTTAPAAQATSYPVTITDCDGTETTYDQAPERIVTIDPSMTELLLQLGLADKIVGYTEFFAPDQQWDVTKEQMSGLNQINEDLTYPSEEAIVAEEPDFVTSVYSYAFGDPLPTRDEWAAQGVDTYQALGECSAEPVDDFSPMYQDIRNLGVIFDVQAEAEAEIARIEAQVADAQRRAEEAGIPSVRIATQAGGTEQPDFYGGSTNAVIELAGSSYLWGDLGLTGTSSWEEFVNRDPQVVWVMPDAGQPVADLEAQLEDDPRLEGVTAIEDQAYIVVPQADATVESPRLADGLDQIVDALIELHQQS